MKLNITFTLRTAEKITVKSPLGMFQNYAIDNDLNYVYDKIKNYYELGTYKSDEEMDKEDQKVAGDIEKPDASGRRSRTRKAEQKAEPVEKLKRLQEHARAGLR